LESQTDYYEQQFVELRERLVRILGLPTVNRLVERAVAEIARAHPAVAKLRITGDDLDFSEMRIALEQTDGADARGTFNALNGVLLLLVARLLGREIAERLTEDVIVADLLEAKTLGDL